MFAWLLSKIWPWKKSDTVKEPGDAAPSCHSDIRLDSEPHQSPPPQSLTKAGIEGVSISDSCSSFLYIPSKITVAILEYLRDDKSSLLILSLVDKLFNELVTPLIHESVDLRCHEYHEPGCIVGRVNSNRMLKRQMCYLVNVTHHPKYLNMVQHLGWEFAAAPWAVFPKMINIQSIDITMNGAFIGGGRIVPVFPNLRKARLAGIFYPGSLECMLLTSPFLTELHLVDMAGEAGSVRAYDPNARTIVHFVDVCVSTPGKLPHLKILNISRLVTECYRNTTQHPGPEWESWARFILHYAHQLEDLRMELDPCHWRPLGQDANPRSIFVRHVLPILKSGKFVLLKHLNLKGVDLTADDEAQLKRSLPLGAQFIWTSVTALNPNFGRRLVGDWPQQRIAPSISTREVGAVEVVIRQRSNISSR